MNGDLFEGHSEVGIESPRLYFRKIMSSGAWHIQKVTDPPGRYTKQTDPEFVRWCGIHGHSTVEEVPGVRDGPPLDSCERCGKRGVEVHHSAPREWFGDELCEQWPTQNLCVPCHRLWHQVAELAAAKVTLRNLRGRGLHRVAAEVEKGVARQEERTRGAIIEDEKRRSRLSEDAA